MADAFRVMSRHSTHVATLFRGEAVQHPNVPWDFIPTWILIATPPAALGIAAAIALNSNLYDDWRQMYFLWAPICVLAAFGLRLIMDAAARASAPNAAGGGFNVYADDKTLIYIKEDCAAAAARGRFWLSIFPANPADLPQDRRAAGFDHDSLNFAFPEHSAILDGDCVIIRALPHYPARHVETGQWIPGEGELWRGEIAVGE